MNLLTQLIDSYTAMKELPLLTGQVTNENVAVFVDLLNKAIPSRMNEKAYTIYQFNRTKYIADKARFVNDITDFKPYESMILWTDPEDILHHFGLQNKVSLNWAVTNQYIGCMVTAQLSYINILTTNVKYSAPPPSPVLERNEDNVFAKFAKEVMDKDSDSENDMYGDIDMGRVYDNMTGRLHAIRNMLELNNKGYYEKHCK